MIARNVPKLAGSGGYEHAIAHRDQKRHLAAILLAALEKYEPHLPVTEAEMEEIRANTRRRVLEYLEEAADWQQAIDRYDAASGDGVAGMGEGAVNAKELIEETMVQVGLYAWQKAERDDANASGEHCMRMALRAALSSITDCDIEIAADSVWPAIDNMPGAEFAQARDIVRSVLSSIFTTADEITP